MIVMVMIVLIYGDIDRGIFMTIVIAILIVIVIMIVMVNDSIDLWQYR